MSEIQDHFSNVHQSANIFERIKSFIFSDAYNRNISLNKKLKFLAELPKVSKKLYSVYIQ